MPRERPKVQMIVCGMCGSEAVNLSGAVQCWVCGSPYTGLEATVDREVPVKPRKSAKQKAREVTEGDDDLATELGLM